MRVSIKYKSTKSTNEVVTGILSIIPRVLTFVKLTLLSSFSNFMTILTYDKGIY